ncbi:IS6 family transposase [Robbsia andropogonis]|uniref:IS6 family transposase n=1 Tax=Robbsia andropogonis TaxID=28092 RepID=UPI000466D8B1|nr:IS6 family transposase [Robbsia andropogonis]
MNTSSIYRGHRFPPAIIGLAVRWYFRFLLSSRDMDELLLERGVIVSYESIRRWCDKFGARFAAHVKITGRSAKTWHLDEMFVRLRGEPYWLWRAVDEQGQELDILLQKRRDTAAAEQFFKRILRKHPAPRVIVTDQLLSYPVAKARVPALAKTKHIFVRAAARVNNRAEDSHQPTRERERRMRGLRDRRRAQGFLSNFGPIRQHFALKRETLGAIEHRRQITAHLASWQQLTLGSQNPSAF